jgi:hypothetical protein
MRVNTQETVPDEARELKAQFITPQEHKINSSDYQSRSSEAREANESLEAQKGLPTLVRDIEELSQSLGDCAIDRNDGSCKLKDDERQLRSLRSSLVKAFRKITCPTSKCSVPDSLTLR